MKVIIKSKLVVKAFFVFFLNTSTYQLMIRTYNANRY